MREILFRCSSLGRLMTEPKTLKEGPLSVGAKTYIRELVAQELFGVDFEISDKKIEKGLRVEDQSIALLNRVRGLSLVKNKERKTDGFLTGEADLFDTQRRRGHDLKSSWSLGTFPIALADCVDRAYEWQMRGYMKLWDADEWEVNYAIVDTPDELIGWEPQSMHFVSHLPEAHRLTTWVIQRDRALEALMVEKVKHARTYFAEVVAEFDRTHGGAAAAVSPAPIVAATTPAAAPRAATPVPEPTF